MNNNPLVQFLAEIVLRMTAKSPLFFKIWQWISAAVAAVAGLPELLKAVNITLPPALTVLENKTVAVAASVAFFMSLMPVKNTVVSTSPNGTPTTVPDSPKKIPFTLAQDLKKQ